MEELEQGQKIKLRFKISPVRFEEIVCSIKWVEYDRIALIYPENEQELAKYLYEGKELEIIIYMDKGVYVFDSIVIDSPFTVDFVIELPEERTKIQRREYIRVPIKLGLILNKTGHKIKTATINVGGGGIRFKVNKDLKVNDIWSFKLCLPRNLGEVQGCGEILYTIKQDNTMASVIKFLNIEENDRNKIIKMCFEEEASSLKMRNSLINNS
ncbi:MAG: PilZ domain-containing protein [bacterium]